MIKLIFFILILFLVYLLFFKKSSIKDNTKNKKRDKKKEIQSEDMVECQNCGTFTTINDVIKKNGEYFCSQKCTRSEK